MWRINFFLKMTNFVRKYILNTRKPLGHICCRVLCVGLIIGFATQCTSDNNYPRNYRRPVYQAPPQYPANYRRSRNYYNPYEFNSPYGNAPYTDYDQYYVSPRNPGYGGEQSEVIDRQQNNDYR